VADDATLVALLFGRFFPPWQRKFRAVVEAADRYAEIGRLFDLERAALKQIGGNILHRESMDF
jgi:hypothetical protein